MAEPEPSLVDADGRVAPGQAGAVIPPAALTAPVEELVPALEALCHALNRPLTLAEAAAVLGRPTRELAPALDALALSLRGHGLMLQRHGDELQLVTRPEVAWAVQRALHPERPARLSRPSMETLAIVAYRQPITRAGIEAIRGVNCDAVLESLERRGLVAEVARQETPGHPRLFGTTLRFLQTVGLERIDDLPPLPEGVSIPQLEAELELTDDEPSDNQQGPEELSHEPVHGPGPPAQ
ncbi:MAG: SMC-Scp complex subunit ScpB [Candidatus Dormibacteria bacterium]